VTTPGPDLPDADEAFSPVVGGPLYKLYLRARLLAPPVGHSHRRITVLVAIAGIPLVLLTAASGTLFGGAGLPFLLDIEANVRLLLGLPLLIAAEPAVHLRMSRAVRQFVDRVLVDSANRVRFDAIIGSSIRLRNSVTVEIVLLAFSTGLQYSAWQLHAPAHAGTWAVANTPGGDVLSAAGGWYAFVSLNLFRFMLLRWYYRLAIWAVFLWRTSRLPLRLNALHPDRAGGLGFMDGTLQAQAPILLAQSVAISAAIANQILHQGMKLPAFRIEILSVAAILTAVAVAPLVFFVPALWRASLEGAREYGMLSTRYVNEFREKWLTGPGPRGEQVVGSGDIQSLADLANAYEVVRNMSIVPVDWKTIARFAVMISLPFAPLALTMIPLDQLIDRVLGKLI